LKALSTKSSTGELDIPERSRKPLEEARFYELSIVHAEAAAMAIIKRVCTGHQLSSLGLLEQVLHEKMNLNYKPTITITM